MPLLKANGTELFYEEQGTGRQTVLLAHGLGFSGRMYHHQVLALRQRYRCITMDFRGQGRSAVARIGYNMDTLVRDAVAVLRHCDATPCHFVGLSMGGFVGLRLALNHPEMLRTLTLINTGAHADETPDRLRNAALATTVRLFGMRPVLRPVMRLLFGQTFMTDPARAEERRRWRKEILANDRTGIVRAATGVRRRSPVLDRIGRIAVPTLIVAGDEDRAAPIEHSLAMHERIPGARLVTLPATGHNCCLEAPDQVNAELLNLFDSTSAPVEEPGFFQELP